MVKGTSGVVGAKVVGAKVVGALVVGGRVVGGRVDGGRVVGALVDGERVVGAIVVLFGEAVFVEGTVVIGVSVPVELPISSPSAIVTVSVLLCVVGD